MTPKHGRKKHEERVVPAHYCADKTVTPRPKKQKTPEEEAERKAMLDLIISEAVEALELRPPPSAPANFEKIEERRRSDEQTE